MYTVVLLVFSLVVQFSWHASLAQPRDVASLDSLDSLHKRTIRTDTGSALGDVYFVSRTRTLKVVRDRGDILKACEYWNNSVKKSGTFTTQVAVVESEMDNLIQTCKRSSDGSTQKKVIYPGTKWCGMGDDADDDNDTGQKEELDKCCRTHDKCKPSIKPFETKFGLFNFAIWTKSHCQCDTNFYNCLKVVNSSDSTIIGITYFNVLEVGCFDKVHPLKCVKYSFLGLICTEYKPDTSKPKEWSFVDTEHTY